MTSQYTNFYRLNYRFERTGLVNSYINPASYVPVRTDVTSERPELVEAMPKYCKIRDCLRGEEHIKSLADRYLPRPGYQDEEFTVENERRYQEYVLRATFLNATGFTQRTTVGKLFTKAATIDLPTRLEMMRDNVNGEGLAFEQLIEQVVAEVFAFGRGGLYADFMAMDDAMVSMAESRATSPTLKFVRAEDIVNWRIDKAKQKVIMVVVREFEETYDDFATMVRPIYKVFKLDPMLTIETWRSMSDSSDTTLNTSRQDYSYNEASGFKKDEQVHQPRMANGERWNVIPFAIIGSSNNDWDIDEPPLASISDYDIALYRTSADLEQMVHLVGQVTPYATGLTKAVVDEFKIKKMRLGSSHFMALKDPASKVGLLQAKSDTMVSKRYADLQDILRKLGAVVFSIDSMQDDQTATAAVYQSVQIHAPLVTTSRNVIAGVDKAIRFAARYVGIDPMTDAIAIKLNSDIIDNPLGIAGLESILNLWKGGAITFVELREQLRVQGLTLHSPEEAESMIDQEKEKRMEQQQQMMATQQPQQNPLQQNLQSRQPPGDRITS